MRLKVLAWNAWAPGLTTQEEWLDWLKAPCLPQSTEDKAPVTFVPAMTRRRLTRLGRTVLQSVHPLYNAQTDGNIPLVFATRWGDIGLTTQILDTFTEDGTVSPTAFSTSVHNAIGGLFSIIFKHLGNVCSLSGANACTSAALVEAAGLLTEHDTVIITIYDDRSPRAFEDFHPQNFPFAMSFKIARAADNEDGFTLRTESLTLETDDTDTLEELKALAFLAGKQRHWTQTGQHVAYHWTKD